MALGAFMMGMLLSESRYSLQIQAMVEPYKGLLMSLFFVAVGMSIDLRAIATQPVIFVQHTLVILLRSKRTRCFCWHWRLEYRA